MRLIHTYVYVNQQIRWHTRYWQSHVRLFPSSPLVTSLSSAHTYTHTYIYTSKWVERMTSCMICTGHVRWNEASQRLESTRHTSHATRHTSHVTRHTSHFYTRTEPIQRLSKIYGGAVDLKGPKLDALIRDKISSWSLVAWRAAAHLVCAHCIARWHTYYWWLHGRTFPYSRCLHW